MKALSELGVSPWPWKANKHGLVESCSANGKAMFAAISGMFDTPNEVTFANASLIAAAPEMAKVCYDLIMWDGNLDAKFLKIIDDAKAAYAKASGEDEK